MEYGFWLVIVFIIIYEPIIGYFDFQKFKIDLKENQDARLKYYKNAIIGLWIPTVFILLLVVFTELTLKDIGLSIPSINTDTLGPLVTYAVLTIGVLYLFGILYYSIGYPFSDKIRTKFTQIKEKEWGNIDYSEIMPITNKEKRLWNYVSLTAGITEEIIYRGFLIFALTYLFPNFSVWLIIIISSLLFGLAHTYQGFTTGVLRTTVFGVIFSILYIGISSILPLVVFHFLIDYIAKLGDSKAQNPKPEDTNLF
ncbi:CPBP family intramembrane glutamic endopeptidase [Lederbergia galactosidilytica]|uniref:CAAX protease n=1 Tax=Lederbergia galactosidilytica TaxID=217031 RepID=A0A0Q9XWJ5_9BACI|nr:CPBP family intramembrane glutamic endopeptidase [Lederbergia galactosidilytica]KRG12901.1 CAAX protease [Lederbergia galactosidilytica]KRG13689.1 CAAX protease [Virgibacillus soli]MBP1916304.1 membrane protease YdiL (CAAX protease family) [Lederbergia galactosidilytica]OAK70682.1 CAAX protease [Lederbergia galactosidilytica]